MLELLFLEISQVDGKSLLVFIHLLVPWLYNCLLEVFSMDHDVHVEALGKSLEL